MAVRITDLVDPGEIEKLKQLDTELKNALRTFTQVAIDFAKGIDIKINCVEDIDKAEKFLIDKSREAANAQRELNRVIGERDKIMANTTNTISRYLMEQERVNKTQREAYTEHEKVKKLLEQFHDTYDGQLARLVQLKTQLDANKNAQKENEKALKSGLLSMSQYQAKQAKLIEQHRSLTQEKRALSQIMTAEEKAAQSQEGSYVQMSQHLELLKKAYKDLSEEGRNSDFGKELEMSIQNLDAHLKDVGADMGEFQRNVGNYAIAGQNGVVATDSLVTAMERQAVTTQDLIDQTKILEEAKLMLNSEDTNYQATLDSVNAKIEENKRLLADVSDILQKDATSVAEAESQNKRLQEALKHVDLSSADAQKRIKELNDKIAANTKLIKENTPALQDQTKAIEQQKKANEGLAGNLLNIIGLNTRFGSSLKGLEGAGTANVLNGLNIKLKAFGKTLLGLLANPWVLAFLGIAGVVAGFKWWYDYNKGLIEASRLTQNFTGITGKAADKITTDMQAVADHMGKGFDDTIGAANTLVQQFGLSWEEAIAKIEDGIEAGADMNGKFVENINQFAPALRDAGVSVDEFISILAETRNGIFDEKGVQDIIKGGTRLRAMTKQIEDSLNACGISAKQMQEDLANGNITMLDAVQQVSAKLKELPENSQEAGLLMKNVFGRTAAEGGALLIQSIADVNTNLDVAKERMGELGKLNREHMEAQKELNATIAAVFKMSGTSFEEMTLSAKTYIAQGLTKVIHKCVDIVNWFIRMYNKSLVFRGAVNSIVNGFKIMWEIAKFILNQLMDAFSALGTMIEGAFTLDWEKVKGGWKEGLNALKGNVETMAKNIASSTADAINNTLHGEMKEISFNSGDDSGDGTGGRNPNGTASKGLPQGIESDADKKAREKAAQKAAKDAEKQAKEELKRLNELEETKIAAMADSHEKELAMIRLKFKKKIDEIRGNGETENALRIQLAEQCQIEIAQCEIKYQKELAKINLENRLAAVEEGSKEELNLKLAKLEASRQAEIEAAEKTGADVNLINEKFNKERLKMEEDYAAKSAELVEKKYANEQADRDNDYIMAVNGLKKRYAEELAAAKGNAGKREAITAKFERDQAALSEKYAIDTAQASVNMIEEVLKTEQLSAEDRLKYEQALAKAKGDLETAMADHAIAEINRAAKADKDALDGRMAKAQEWLQVTADSLNAMNELMTAVHENKVAQIEDEQEILTTASENEQERISELVEKEVITEEEGEARKRAAEAQTAKKNEELEKKKAQLKYKQAVFDKALSVANIGINTAMSIMRLWVDPGWPMAIPMMAVVGALGAINLATVLATPIPKYAKGTDYHKGGPAIVGDGGVPEIVFFHGKSWVTPDTPTLVDLPEGATVVPTMDMLISGIVRNTETPLPPAATPPVIVNNDYRRLEDKLDTLISISRRQYNETREAAIDAATRRYIADRI